MGGTGGSHDPPSSASPESGLRWPPPETSCWSRLGWRKYLVIALALAVAAGLFGLGFVVGRRTAEPEAVTCTAAPPATGATKIAFHSAAPDGRADVFVVDPDGENEVRVAGLANVDDHFPTWSPDGTKLAFQSQRGPVGLYVVSIDDPEPRYLGDGALAGGSPAWSPDGCSIAFHRRSAGVGTAEIHLVSVAGVSAPVQLTDNGYDDWNPTWSPDGSKLAVQARTSGRRIHVIEATPGSQPTPLYPESAGDGYPAWSPDGSRIAFEHVVSEDRIDIWVVDVDGDSEPINLTAPSESKNTEPTWSPDGTRIAFASNRLRDDNWEIFVMDATDGSGLENVSNRPGNDREPSWSPVLSPETADAWTRLSAEAP